MKLRLAILALCCTAEAYAQPAHAPLEATGGTFTLGAETTLVADEGLFPLAEYAAEYLKCPVERQAAADGVLSLLIDPAPEAAAESYRLEITPDHITVRGADYGGVFNGLQALFRLLPPEIYARTRASSWWMITIPFSSLSLILLNLQTSPLYMISPS